MDNCQTCHNAGALEVTDTQEIQPGLWIPLRNRTGCEAHPPVGLKVGHDSTLTLVAPAGYTINQYGVLVKG
jgi:hypothetical protein